MPLCWLASYPKSGNTWLRAMLTVYSKPEQPLDLGKLVGYNTLDSLSSLTEALGFDAALLDMSELTVVRAKLFRDEAARTGAPRFLKTHLANVRCADGNPLFGADTGRAVYLVRHPFDVALSYAHYVAQSAEEMTRRMIRSHIVLDRPGTGRPRATPQPMGSWREHVISWIERPRLELLLVRYEDMHADPTAVLADVVRFAGLPWSRDALQAAVEQTRFSKLQGQEASEGFPEKSPLAQRFFRSGAIEEGRGLGSDCRRELAGQLTHPLDRLEYRI